MFSEISLENIPSKHLCLAGTGIPEPLLIPLELPPLWLLFPGLTVYELLLSIGVKCVNCEGQDLLRDFEITLPVEFNL